MPPPPTPPPIASPTAPALAPEPLAPLAAALHSGERDLLAYLDELAARFAALEPAIHAFVPEADRFDRLRREAAALLARFPDPAARPPLFGVFVGIKDIFHASGFPTAAGSRLPPADLAGAEGPAVGTLRAAGALVLGKTATTEFAFYAPGPTRNPRRPEHTPGGSSSGSAAAVAAGLCPLALGTQTIGSISRPAAFCGVVGFKPSYDRISRDGVVPLSPSLDHLGLFTADAAGAALAAGLVCAGWRAAAAGGHDTRGLILGVPEGPYLERASAAGLEHFQAACGRLAAAGHEVRRAPTMADFGEIEARHWRILAAEAAAVHADLYARHRDLYHPKTAELIERGQRERGAPAGRLAADLAGREALRRELTALMDEHRLDLFVTPAATGPAPAGLDSTGDPVMNLPWTHAGLPTLALPAGRNAQGLPLGLQLAARFGADEELLAWGVELEASLNNTVVVGSESEA